MVVLSQMIINLIDAISSDWDFDDIDEFWDPNDLVPEDLAKQDFWQRDSNGKLQTSTSLKINDTSYSQQGIKLDDYDSRSKKDFVWKTHLNP